MEVAGSCRPGLQCCEERWNAKDGDGSLEIEAENREGHLSRRLPQAAHQESWASHQPLHDPERVFDEVAAQLLPSVHCGFKAQPEQAVVA